MQEADEQGARLRTGNTLHALDSHEPIFKTHAESAAHLQRQTNPYFILVNALGQFDTFIKIAHSKKKNCDVCKHPYSFTKVYAPDMPNKLPTILLLRRLAQQVFLALLFVLRGISVATIWLGVLPWVTVWTWRMYFSMGESAAWWLTDRARPASSEDSNPFYNKIRYQTSPSPSKNFFAWVTSHPVWVALPSDIFTGQIIAALIVLTFVAVFLLREWISQNARPGVFEEEPLPEELPPPAPVQLPHAQLPQVQPARQHLDVAQIRIPAQLPIPVRREPVQPVQPIPPVQPVAPVQPVQPVQPANNNQDLPIEEDNGDTDWVDEGSDDGREEPERMKKKKREAPPAQDYRLTAHRHPTRRAASPPTGLRQRRQFHSPAYEPTANGSKGPQSANFEFTFQAPQRLPPNPATSTSAAGPSSRSGTPDTFNPVEHTSPVSTSRTSTPIPGPLNGHPFRFGEAAPPFVFGGQNQSQPPVEPLPFDDDDDSEFSFVKEPPVASSSTAPLSAEGFRFTWDGSGSRPNDLAIESGRFFALADEYKQNIGLGREVVEQEPFESLDSPMDVDEPDSRVQEEQGAPGSYQPYVEGSSSDTIPLTPPLESTSSNEAHSRLAERLEEPADVPVDVETETNSDVSDRADADEFVIRYPGGDEAGELDWHEGLDEDEEGHGHGFDAEDGDEGFDPQEEQDDFFVDEDDGEWEAAVGEDEEEEMEAANGFEGLGPEEIAMEAEILRNGRPDDLGAAAAAAAAGIDVNDDADGNVEDDMEGAMEAIGMRGPIFGVFQNAALMIFVLDTAIGLGVWLPFTMGKTWALLTLDPPRMLKILHLPIRAMRIVTDPFVDTFTWLFVDVLLPWVFAMVKSVFQVFSFVGLKYFGPLLGNRTTEAVADWPARLYNQSSKGFEDLLSHLWNPTTSPVQNVTNVTVIFPANASSSLLDSLPDYLGFTEPYFASLGSEVRTTAVTARQTWIDLALGSGAKERLFAVILGYFAIGLGVMFYFHVLATSGTGVGLRNTIRQQFLVVKVAAFIFIELVIFPLGCGIVLDLSTIWLFPEANLSSRKAFFVQAPLTAMFYHWIAGTMFMYAFAVLLSGCRKVMRPGAMWFIKDPQDPNAHPIRDILDRPTFTQLRKICISGVMYSFVVVCVVGSVAGLLTVGGSSIMPFRWKNREPLSSVPVDLIFLHLVLPYTMRYFQPKPFIKQLATTVWKYLAARLRLTSYFFGTRNEAEEYTPRKRWFRRWAQPEEIPEDEEVVLDGSFRRVPATDNLALPRDMRATVPVNADGEPLDDAGKELMRLQNTEAEKAKRDVKEDYKVVYIPPHFRWRMIAFVVLLWMFGAISLGVCVAVPIQFGRMFFNTFMSREVHDGYSFLIGFYLLWMCYLVGKAVDLLDKRRQRRGSSHGPRAHLYILVLKRGFLWVAKTSYMVFFLGIVIPILLATVMDLFLVFPIRFAIDPAWKPRIRVVDSWALGLLYAKIATRTERLQPPNSITRGWRHIKQHGWTRPDPISATVEVIAPLTGGLLAMIIFPAALFLVFKRIFPTLLQDDRFLFMHVYPVVFIMAGAFRTSYTFLDLMSSWSQTIRDKEFLVEMRLKNHDPGKDKEKEKQDNGSGSNGRRTGPAPVAVDALPPRR